MMISCWFLIGYLCIKFSISYKSIMRIEGFVCNDFIMECLFGYNLIEVYKCMLGLYFYKF